MRQVALDTRGTWLPLGIGTVAGLLAVILLGLPVKWMIAILAALVIGVVALTQTDLRRYFIVLLVLSLPLATFSKQFFAREGYFGVPGIGFGIIDMVLVALYAHWIATGVDTNGPRRVLRSPVNLAALAFLAATALSLFVAEDRALALFGLFDMVKAYALFFYVACNVRPRYLGWIVDALCATVLLQELLAVAQYFTGSSLGLASLGESELMRMTFGGETFVRVAATLVHPNQFSNFLGVLLPILLSVLLTGRRGPGRRILYSTVFALGMLVFILSFSRTGWIHIAASSLVVLLLSVRRGIVRREISNVAVVGGLLASIMLLVFSGAIVARLFQSDAVLVTMRFDMARVALRMIGDSPVLGMGANNYVNVLPDYDFLGVMSAPVHNLYLLIAAELGAVGLASFLVVVATLVRRLLQAGRTSHVLSGAIAVGLLGATAGFAVDGLSDFSYALASMHALFWFSAGLAVALGPHPGQDG
ncbi:MAG TPA: O-antigen ligase family protein [Coriobacteriia bacterium]